MISLAKKLLIGAAALNASILLTGCAEKEADAAAHRTGIEIVMCPGSSIDVAAADRSLSINAVGETTRRYRIAEFDETAKLIPRTTRFNGSLGIYRPSGVGALHLNVEESLLFFDTEEDLKYWLRWAKDFYGGQFYYTSDGLVVFWELTFPPPNVITSTVGALSVDVRQVLLKGKKPENLPGAQDGAFRINNPSTDCTIGDTRNSSFIASSSQVIAGRRYSGWAIDIMRAHDITPDMVELTLKTDDPTVRDGYRTYAWRPKSGKDWLKAFSVTVDSDDSVVFLYK